jgi:hypothetical protein
VAFGHASFHIAEVYSGEGKPKPISGSFPYAFLKIYHKKQVWDENGTPKCDKVLIVKERNYY